MPIKTTQGTLPIKHLYVNETGFIRGKKYPSPERGLSRAIIAIPMNIGNFTFVTTIASWCEAAKSAPAPEILADPFWIEGEFACLVGTPLSSKSTLEVQIGAEIAKSRKVIY